MLSHFSQYSPLGLLPPLSGMQGFGGMPGVGQSPGFQSPGFGGAGIYGQGIYGQGLSGQGGYSPFAASPFALSPYQHHQAPGASYASYAQPGGTFSPALQIIPVPALQIIPVIGHLAQQIHLQGDVTQQIGVALNHLAQQLAVLSQQVMLSQQVQGGTGLGFSSGQGLGFGGQPFGAGQGTGQPGWQNGPFAAGGQPFGFTPFVGAAGLGGQTPPWAAQRSQTIQ
jgi:hypothetical protein